MMVEEKTLKQENEGRIDILELFRDEISHTLQFRL